MICPTLAPRSRPTCSVSVYLQNIAFSFGDGQQRMFWRLANEIPITNLNSHRFRHLICVCADFALCRTEVDGVHSLLGRREPGSEPFRTAGERGKSLSLSNSTVVDHSSANPTCLLVSVRRSLRGTLLTFSRSKPREIVYGAGAPVHSDTTSRVRGTGIPPTPVLGAFLGIVPTSVLCHLGALSQVARLPPRPTSHSTLL